MRKIRVGVALMATCWPALGGTKDVQGKPPYLNQPIVEPIQDARSIGAGHDYLAIIYAALNLPEKDTFETELQYSERMAVDLKRHVYGSVSLSDRIAIVGDLWKEGSGSGGLIYSYDPDKQLLRICTDNAAESDERVRFAVPVKLMAKTDAVGSRIGQNAFGVKAKVSQFRTLIAQAKLDAWDRKRLCTESTPMPPDKARDYLSVFPRWAIIGTTMPPYGLAERTDTTASIDDPREGKTITASLYLTDLVVVAYSPFAKYEIFFAGKFQ